MTNLVNIWSETNADIIGDDSTPTLTLKNTSSGIGLSIDTTSGTGAALDTVSDNTSYAARIRSAASASPALQVTHSVLQGPTIAPLKVIASAASGAFFDFRGGVISTASLGVTAANVVGLLKVWYDGSGGSGAGWMPIYNNSIAL
jgi:hypothetical protein